MNEEEQFSQVKTISLLDFLAELVEPPADCIAGYSAGDIPKE